MSKERILIIDDEAAIRRLLKISLEAEGYILLEADKGQNGLVMASTHRPDLVVLDLGLPDMDGLEVLKKLREWSSVPVIVLTVKDSEMDKVALLDAGADDYLTKPFSVPELLARFRAALRHTLPSETQTDFHSGHLEVDLIARKVSVAGVPVKLTATEYDILKLLVRYAGKVVTQGHMLKEIWGPHASEQTQYLRVYISQLRKKIEQNPARPELIITEPAVGYRLLVKEVK